MSIDELEASAAQTAAQRHQELTQARQWINEACKEIDGLRVLVTSREDMVITRDALIATFEETRRDFCTQITNLKGENSKFSTERDALRTDMAALRSVVEAERLHHASESQR